MSELFVWNLESLVNLEEMVVETARSSISQILIFLGCRILILWDFQKKTKQTYPWFSERF